ncbi:hypothetical protein [Mycobacterium sp. shizuoka-1]|uniref:hypothetical protein n=1 Tax=Mycobacterium sp. shizuoka-1 TaxID=2039281 RepID=UPI000C05E61B|nr:hypothetical protein [Mycobacterium sp. shizuoka-1]GAY13774.1 hypothetical protein MSZK_05000 [Mycobacterium sp. shizuoka-1]
MGAVSAVNMFSLRPGVTAAEFEAFSADLDRPTCLAFDVVESFEVYLVEGDHPSRVDVVEIMTVRSWPEWEYVRDNAPEFVPVLRRFGELVDTDSISTLFTRHLTATEEN